jgi:hypothetical protein
MLADNRHGHGYYMGQVISFLRYWIDQSTKRPSVSGIPLKLYLVLEANKEFENNITNFISTGELFPLYSYLTDCNAKSGVNFFTVDYLQFITELRSVFQVISTANQADTTHRLELRILCPESDPPYSIEDLFSMPPYESDKMRSQWFTYVRDRLSSATIKAALDSNQEFHALVFYGAGHLVRGKQNKSQWIGSEEPMYDYFLVHFLDSLIGRSQVSTFMNGCSNDPTKIEKCNNSIDELRYGNEDHDFLIRGIVSPPNPYPVFFIPSTITLRATLDGIRKYGHGTSTLDHALTSHFIISLYIQLARSYFYTTPVLKAKIDSACSGSINVSYETHIRNALRIGNDLINSFDAIENIQRIDEWISRHNIPDATAFSSILETVLGNLPGCPDANHHLILGNVGAPPQQPSSKNDNEVVLPCKNELIKYMCINLLWMATPTEREGAIRTLQKLTGLNYSTPEEWTTWWRSKYSFH